MQSEKTLVNLQKVLALLKPAANLAEMLTLVGRQLVEMFEVDHYSVMFFGADDLEGTIVAEYPDRNVVGFQVPLTNSPLIQQMKATGQPVAIGDAQNEALMGRLRGAMRRLEIKSILVIPLIVNERLVGGLSLNMMQAGRRFTAAEIELAHLLGDQIAVAVDYTRALEAAEASRRQAKTLQKVNQALGESLNLDEILPLILEQLEKVIPVDASSIYLLVEGGIQLRARRGPYNPFTDQQIIPLDQLWGAAAVIDSRSPLLVSNTHTHPDWLIYEDSPLRSWLGTPLLVRGEVVGILNMDGYTPNQFSREHIPLAWSFARQSAIAINNARLYGQARRRAELLASVQEIEVKIVASLDLEDVLNAVTTAVSTLLAASQVRIYLYDSATDSFTLTAMLDADGRLKTTIAPPRKNGLTAQVARSGQYVTVSDVLQHPLYRYARGAHGFRSITCIPLKKLDRVLGVLNVFYATPRRLTAEEIDVLQLLTTQAAVALENARLYSAEQSRLQDEARRSERWRRIQEISSTLNASLDLDEVLTNACEQFVRLMAVDHCVLVLFEGEGAGRIVAEYPLSDSAGKRIPLESPALQQLVADRRLFVAANAQEDPRLGRGRLHLEAAGVQSILMAPLIVHDRVIGAVGVGAIQQPRHFTEEDFNMTRIVADQMAIAVANAQTYQAEHTARIQADTLRQAAATLNETLDLDVVLNRILKQLERVITFDTSSIIMREKDAFRVVAIRGFPSDVAVLGMTFETDTPHFRQIARSRRPLVIPDTIDFEGWRHDGPTPIRSWIGAPLLVSNRLIGLLSVDHLQPDFYAHSDSALVKGFADLAAIALENARLYEVEVKQVEQELAIARQIQRGFFPDHIPDIPGWRIVAACFPARETGGDFYEFVERSDDRVGVVVGDVSGKSIPAAMLMASAQSVVSSKGSDYRSPAQVMAETNRLLYDDVPPGSFVALSYALLEPHTNQICFSSGGQVAPFLLPANGQPVRLIETPGNHLPVGVVANAVYQEMSLALEAGDVLVFYTDGVVEQTDEAGRMFGFEGVAATLEKLPGQSPEAILQSLLEASRIFAENVDQHDDVTLVVIQRTTEGG